MEHINPCSVHQFSMQIATVKWKTICVGGGHLSYNSTRPTIAGSDNHRSQIYIYFPQVSRLGAMPPNVTVALLNMGYADAPLKGVLFHKAVPIKGILFCRKLSPISVWFYKKTVPIGVTLLLSHQ